jgi:hypothetical protein
MRPGARRDQGGHIYCREYYRKKFPVFATKERGTRSVRLIGSGRMPSPVPRPCRRTPRGLPNSAKQGEISLYKIYTFL